MIEVNKPVREAFRASLQGFVTYNAANVNVYSEINPNESEVNYIILHTQTESDDSDKFGFKTTGTILIDIVNKQQGVSYNIVDAIAAQVINIIQPTRRTTGITDTFTLQFLNIKKLSSTTLTLPSATGNVMRRLLRYEFKIIEK